MIASNHTQGSSLIKAIQYGHGLDKEHRCRDSREREGFLSLKFSACGIQRQHEFGCIGRSQNYVQSFFAALP